MWRQTTLGPFASIRALQEQPSLQHFFLTTKWDFLLKWANYKQMSCIWIHTGLNRHRGAERCLAEGIFLFLYIHMQHRPFHISLKYKCDSMGSLEQSHRTWCTTPTVKGGFPLHEQKFEQQNPQAVLDMSPSGPLYLNPASQCWNAMP